MINGWPSLPDLFKILSSIQYQLGGLNKGQEITNDTMRVGFDRVHQRIDNLLQHGRTHIDKLQDRVTTLEVRPPGQVPGSRSHPGRLTRIKMLAELVAPLRELVTLVVVIAGGLASLFQASAVKEALLALASALGVR